ncbi:kelch-like protein 5 [Zootermopsis nevadensis]|uniref:kelch-like protein 5 n=1 Tax=Zootermopsis nevadensis TaxID=136037 RepID=UPI000B8E6283|nr:kelch-like protein 5 [Zootermopsis nevadensis]
MVEGVKCIGPRVCHGTTVVGFDIYVIGGTDDGFGGLSSCFCFNSVTKTCRNLAPMYDCRSALMVAVLRGAVYAIGGCDGRRYHSTVERYDCKTNQWSLVAPMNRRRRGASAAVLNDKIYVAGGSNFNGVLHSVEVYDPDTNRWTFVTRMLSQREDFSCVTFHGCLYAIGGHNGPSYVASTEKYDPAEDTWTEIPDLGVYSVYLSAEVFCLRWTFCRGQLLPP